MKLLNSKSILLAIVATAFTLSAIQSEARQPRKKRPVSPERVINMSYNMADRLETEAHSMSRPQLKKIQSKLKDIRNILNGVDDIDTVYPTEYSAICKIISYNSLGQSRTTLAGERKGTAQKILEDCKYLATSQYGTTAKIRLSEVKLTQLGNAAEQATCKIISYNSLGQSRTTLIGTIAATSLQGLKGECDLFAKEIYGTNAKSRLSEVSSI